MCYSAVVSGLQHLWPPVLWVTVGLTCWLLYFPWQDKHEKDEETLEALQHSRPKRYREYSKQAALQVGVQSPYGPSN